VGGVAPRATVHNRSEKILMPPNESVSHVEQEVVPSADFITVLALAQDGSKQMKQWYEESEKARW
jgi:hypothetical protein